MTDTGARPPVEIGLNAAVVAISGRSPCILAVGRDGVHSRDALPFGPFDPQQHRTFETSLRASVEAQTALKLGYIEQPLEILRTIHSFDPCMACAVHIIDPRTKEVRKFKVA